jgi:hypothetical protein
MSQKRCVCGKVITSNYDLCNSCLAKYGKDRTEWPEWLIFMVADLKHERRQERIARDKEMTFSELGFYD